MGRISLVMDDHHTDGAIIMAFSVIMVMEVLPDKGEEEEQEYEDREAP